MQWRESRPLVLPRMSCFYFQVIVVYRTVSGIGIGRETEVLRENVHHKSDGYAWVGTLGNRDGDPATNYLSYSLPFLVTYLQSQNSIQLCKYDILARHSLYYRGYET
jgi:hypothetical protein